MVRNVFEPIFTEIIGPNDVDFSTLSRRIHSRLYTDMTVLGGLLERIGLPSNLFEMMARDEICQRPPIRSSVFRLLRNRRLLRFIRRQVGSKNDIAAFVDTQNRALESHRRADLSGEALPALLKRVDDLMELHGRSQWYVFAAAFNMMMRKRLLDGFLKRNTPGVTAPDLLGGLSGLKSFEPNRRFLEMAAITRKLDGELNELVSSGDDRSIRNRLPQDPSGRALLDKADSFLADFGFLSANGTDFSTESWVERPDLVWRNVHRMIPLATDWSGRDGDLTASEARDRAASRLDPVRRPALNRLLCSTIDYMKLRERASLLLSEDAFQMRRVFLAIADILVERGILDRADDVFYLYVEELRSMVDGTGGLPETRKLVTERREEMVKDAEISPPDTICGDTPPPTVHRPDDRRYLVGIGGSAGIVEGRVIVVLDPDDAPSDLTREDILVVPFTDIGWTPLFAGIGGIVAETGGQLSHTSIVAREYNLPAVVSVLGATQLLKNGQIVTLDGRLGRVYLKNHKDLQGEPQ
jgi:pyruvate,water dikinase